MTDQAPTLILEVSHARKRTVRERGKWSCRKQRSERFYKKKNGGSLESFPMLLLMLYLGEIRVSTPPILLGRLGTGISNPPVLRRVLVIAVAIRGCAIHLLSPCSREDALAPVSDLNKCSLVSSRNMRSTIGDVRNLPMQWHHATHLPFHCLRSKHPPSKFLFANGNVRNSLSH